jgi:hypothetical protein
VKEFTLLIFKVIYQSSLVAGFSIISQIGIESAEALISMQFVSFVSQRLALGCYREAMSGVVKDGLEITPTTTKAPTS